MAPAHERASKRPHLRTVDRWNADWGALALLVERWLVPLIPFPSSKLCASDRPGAVKGARFARQSEPLTARTDLESYEGEGKGIPQGGNPQGETGLLQDGKKHSRWVRPRNIAGDGNPYLAVRAVLMTRTSKWNVDKSALQDAEHSPAHFQGDLFINRGLVATEACLWDGVTPAVTPYTQSSRYKTKSGSRQF